MTAARRETVGVRVGRVLIGGGAPVAVQSMANTDTADARATAEQCLALARAGSELVRVTVNRSEAAVAVPEIRHRLREAGCEVPLIGDFHYNGHILLTLYPECARALDKYRINPGNVGQGSRRNEQFTTICRVARDNGKPVRIGVNGGSLDRDLVARKMAENTDRGLGRTSEEILGECLVLSALQSTELGLEAGLRDDQIVVSCKVSRPQQLIEGVPGPRPPDAPAAPSGPDRGWHGHERAGVVSRGDGHPAERGNRRDHPPLAHAEARRRPLRRGLRRL